MRNSEHPCPSCPPTIQKGCAETASFPCEERRFAKPQRQPKPTIDAEVDAWKDTLDPAQSMKALNEKIVFDDETDLAETRQRVSRLTEAIRTLWSPKK